MSKAADVFGMTRSEYMPILMQKSLQNIYDNNGRMENVNSLLTEMVRKQMQITQAKLDLHRYTDGKSYFQKEIEFAWTYLKLIGLIRRPTNGVREITKAGRNALKQKSELKMICQSGIEADRIQKSHKEMEDYDAVAEMEASKIRKRPRKEQAKFRSDVISACKICLVTGISYTHACDACHIRDVYLEGTFTKDNGLLMRKDIHWLYDRGDLLISPEGNVEVSDKVVNRDYGIFARRIDIPVHINREFIEEKYDKFKYAS